MARKIPGKELGIDAPYVRVSTGQRPGKILAVQHPIFGWLPYRQWALLRLIPEERIIPAIIMGISTFWVLKVTMAASGKVVSIPIKLSLGLVTGLTTGLRQLGPFKTLGIFTSFFSPFFKAAIPDQPATEEEAATGIPDSVAQGVEDVIRDNPLPFYGALLMAAMVIAGLDAGDVLRALVELIDIL